MKKRQTDRQMDTQTESWGWVVWTLSWRNWNILEVQNVYYIEVKREAVIAYNWTRRWVYNKQINKEVGGYHIQMDQEDRFS